MGGGSLTPFFFYANLLVRVKLGYPPNFNFLGKPLLGEKYAHGKKKEEETIMPSLVATLSAPARTTCVRKHFVRTKIQTPSGRKVHGRKERRRRRNNAKFSGHYVRPRTHNVCMHALRSHQLYVLEISLKRIVGPTCKFGINKTK